MAKDDELTNERKSRAREPGSTKVLTGVAVGGADSRMHQLFSKDLLEDTARLAGARRPSLQPGVEGPRGWSSSRREDCDGPAGGGSRPGPMTGPAQAAAPVQGRGEETAERPKAAEAQGTAGQEDREANAPGGHRVEGGNI